MRAFVFTAKSDFARFRIPHTTSSALTFLCIHPIAVKGLVGGVLGIDYSEIFDFSKKMQVGIQVLNQVNFDTQSFKVISLKGSAGSTFNFPSNIQFLRDVHYRIFLKTDEEIGEKLKSYIQESRCEFTPYLGASEHIAKLKYEGDYNVLETQVNKAHSIIPKEIFDFEAEAEFHIFEERIPVKNSIEREYIEYEKVFFSPGGTLDLKENINNVCVVGDYNVFFF